MVGMVPGRGTKLVLIAPVDEVNPPSPGLDADLYSDEIAAAQLAVAREVEQGEVALADDGSVRITQKCC